MAPRPAWFINDIPLADLGISNATWVRENQQPEEISWLDPRAAFDAPLRWVYDDPVVLRLGDAVVLRARIRNTPRNLAPGREGINYRALGPWAWLDEMPYVQDYATDDVGGTEQRGDVILGQDGSGERILLETAVSDVIASAIAAGCPIAMGVLTGLDYAIPLDRTTDLSHADAIMRLLQAAPSHVAWWDHSGLLPKFNCAPRSALDAVSFPVRPAGLSVGGTYAPIQSIKLDALYHLQASAVCVIFRREDVVDGKPSTKTIRQITPGGANPSQPRCLTRTWDLAGSVKETRATYITQPTRTQFINENLSFGAGVLIPSASAFDDVARFWKRKFPALKKTGVTILAFRKGTRTKMAEADDDAPDAAFTPACERELLAGSITDWMQKKLNIAAEYQKISVEVLYKAPTDKPGVTEVKAELLTAVITATSAQTRTDGNPYSMLDTVEESFTPAEEPPPGISDKLYQALSELQHDGEIGLADLAGEYDVGPGKVVNLQLEARPEWAAMRALVQSAAVPLDGAITTIRVGYAHQLSIDDLKDLWRSNKTRQTVTSTRKYNPDGGAQQAGLSVYNPRNDVSSTPIPTFQEKVEVAPAGAIATKEELVAAIKSRYETLGVLPLSGQWIDVTVSGKGKFRAIIVTSDSNLGGQWNATFTMTKDGVTIQYWVTMHQLGIY